MVSFVFSPQTSMFELLFKKRIKSKVVLRKAVGFFEVEKVGPNRDHPLWNNTKTLSNIALLRQFWSTFPTSKNPTAFLRATFPFILFLKQSSNILVSGKNTKPCFATRLLPQIAIYTLFLTHISSKIEFIENFFSSTFNFFHLSDISK